MEIIFDFGNEFVAHCWLAVTGILNAFLCACLIRCYFAADDLLALYGSSSMYKRLLVLVLSFFLSLVIQNVHMVFCVAVLQLVPPVWLICVLTLGFVFMLNGKWFVAKVEPWVRKIQ